jgi:uncharacterized protein YigE (DUF2233 family)
MMTAIFPSRSSLLVTKTLVCVLFGFFTSTTVASDWKEVTSGLSVRTDQIAVGASGQNVEINALLINPSLLRTKVVAVHNTINRQKLKFPTYSLRELARVVRPIAIVNGGFSSSYTLPLPSGLLIENQRTIAVINDISKTQSGVLCIGDKKVQILTRAEYKTVQCKDALQSGPLLVEGAGKVGVFQSEHKKLPWYRRSFIAVRQDGQVILGVAGEISLYDLALYIAATGPKGGLGAVRALNLSGDVESGLYYSNDGTRLQTYGNMDAPIASAIAVVRY